RGVPAQYLLGHRQPHVQPVNDWHFVMSGSIIKGLQLEDGLQGVLYVQAGEWICLTPKAVNWVITSSGQPTLGISYFPQPVGSFSQVDHPEVTVLPTMNF